MTGAFLKAEWRHLVMLSYEVDPEVLAALLPHGTELDIWRGKTFVSMVGFRFLKTRVHGIPIPFHRDFDEVNLRFYVKHDHPEGVRRGVVFVKEIVPRAAIAWVARRVYNENYVALPMRHRVAPPEVVYEWHHRGEWARMAVRLEGEPQLPHEDSEEAFITEHYWGYAAQRDGSAMEYRVEHPKWNVWGVSECELSGDLEPLYGVALSSFLTGRPSSAFVADGSAIAVREGRKVKR